MNSTSSSAFVRTPVLPTVFFPNVAPALVILTILALVAIGWLIYTSILFYHWKKYAHASALTTSIMSVHILVSGALFALALSSML